MTTTTHWLDVNRAVLMTALDRIRGHLQRHAARVAPGWEGAGQPADPARGAEPLPATDDLSTLAVVTQVFGLTPFERDILVLACGADLDATFPALSAAASGDPSRTEATFGLALAALPGAHWSALTPDAPLRRWDLVRLAYPAGAGGGALTRVPLRVDERVLHFLVGLDSEDERLRGIVAAAPGRTDPLPPGQEQAAARLARLLAEPPAVVVTLGGPGSCRDTVARAVTLTGMPARLVRAADLPADPAARAELAMLLDRETLLTPGPLVVAGDDPSGGGEPGAAASLAAWLGRLRASAVVVLAAAGLPLPEAVRLDVPDPAAHEQRACWAARLAGGIDSSADKGADKGAGEGEGRPVTEQVAARLAGAFHLPIGDIEAIAGEAVALGQEPWQVARSRCRTDLARLAPQVPTRARWADLVVPTDTDELLRGVLAQARHRHTVLDEWGMGAGGRRGTGVSALFSGASGTGKTLAAEVIAGELDLDLFRIDLSQVVSKYIGETEKNLAQVFDAADRGGCVLLFDECDALFGKRTQTKDAHDRHANVEVAYLLQRLEAFRGLAVLTTNLKENIDTAFVRRLHFMVNFPFPDVAERERMWRRMFPATTPTDGLRFEALAKLVVSGGAIRSIALTAAFLAADDGAPVTMTHLLRAARREMAKLERPLPVAEVGEWA